MIDQPSGGPLARRYALLRLLNRLNFRTKFVILGMAVAMPLCVLAGFAASQFNQVVEANEARGAALKQSAVVRSMMLELAVHRGLSASVLAGAEGLSSELVARQARLLTTAQRLQQVFNSTDWNVLGKEDPAWLDAEVRALIKLPDARDPYRNFDRHTQVIDKLLAVLHRVGLELSSGENHRVSAAAYEVVFITLPSLMEDLGRQRGWGSALLTLGSFSSDEVVAYMLHAGGASQRLRFVRSDLSTLLRLQARLQKAGLDASLLSKALDRAAAFSAASIQTVVSRQGGDEQALAHFREATQAIEGLREANETIGDLLSAEAQQDLTRAERGRALSLAVMGLIVLLLGGLYATFERSTVLRLRSLAQSSRRMAGGHFTDTVTVDGSDEIAALGTALDEMRQTLQDAIEQKALALAAQDADRAKTEFLARWSHDLRTPLAAVLGFAQVLEERRDGQLSHAQHEDVARIRTAAEHLLRLVQDVLDIASIEARGPSLVLEAIDPDALAAEAVELVASNAQAQAQGISLSMGRSAQPCHVRADRTRLLQVLLNLLTNAIKFNRSGGLARIDIQASADEVVIEVSDQGMGLKPSEVARLFKPFVRLDAVERGIPGHGLGLATVRSLVSAMGGTVSVRSAPGQGSTFCVHLRRCEAGPMSTRSASAQMQEAAQALALQGRLAYVEDDEVNVLLMQAMIERHTGLQLSTFPDAAAALAAAEDFDCWIIDLHLPDSDGLRLFEAIQARRGSAVRAILFSADAQPRLRQQALEAGFIDHWTKPMAWESMRTALMRLKSPPG